jgi:hypothetical protein
VEQTIKHISIFLVFLVCVYLWKEGEPYINSYAKHLIPMSFRKATILFFWSTMVVAIWHLLFFYMGKMSNKAAYITSAVVVIGALIISGKIL